jgi:hypothetical protein
MSVLVFLAASGLSVGGLHTLIAYQDYPIWALRKDISVAALVELLIEPSGKVKQCRVESVVGDPKLAEDVCKLLTGRKVEPPQLADGTRIHGRTKTIVRFFVPETPVGDQVAKVKETPELTIFAKNLPASVLGRSTRLEFAIDQTGHVTDCGPGYRNLEPEIAEIACKNSSGLKIEPLIIPNSGAVPFVTSIRVELQEAPA